MDWLKSVISNVLEAGAELANEFEPDANIMSAKLQQTEQHKSTESAPTSPRSSDPTNLKPATGSKRPRTQSLTDKSKNSYIDADPLSLGITPLLSEYVRNLCQHPQTWVEFPVEEQLAARLMNKSHTHQLTHSQPGDNKDLLDYTLSGKEEAHALAILKHVPELSQLRYELCPRQLSEDRFWKIYFLLLSNKLQLRDSDEYFKLPDPPGKHMGSNAFYSLYRTDHATLENAHRFSAEGSGTLSTAMLHDEIPWWHANIDGYRTVTYENTFLHPLHGQQGKNSNWERMDLKLLKHDRPKIFKILLRTGVPDQYRHIAWKISPTSSIAKLINLPSDIKNKHPVDIAPVVRYEKHLVDVFGPEVPIVCSPFPTFGGFSDVSFHKHHVLSPGGTLATKRILVVLAMTKPYLHYGPVLTNLSE